MIRFLFDEQVPSLIAKALQARGVDVLEARTAGLRGADDTEVLRASAAWGRILVTQDRDFDAIASLWQRLGRPFPGILALRGGRIPVGPVIETLELVAAAMGAEELADRLLYISV